MPDTRQMPSTDRSDSSTPVDYASGDTSSWCAARAVDLRRPPTALRGAGVTVYNLVGGIEGVVAGGQPIVRDDGTPGVVA